MRRLEEASIRVFMIRGNHESESTITKCFNLPENVHVFPGHGGVQELRDFGVAIRGPNAMRLKACYANINSLWPDSLTSGSCTRV